MNKKLVYFLLMLIIGGFMVSCDDYETYAEQKDAEKATIAKFVADHKIKIISEEEFEKDSLTDTLTNEYVLFSNTGIYMQVVSRGCGEVLKSGESATVLCRFTEFNIKGDSIQLSNMDPLWREYFHIVENINVTKKSGSYYASFNTDKGSLMATQYNTASVPAGWLVPLSYIKLGRPQNETDEIAHVRLIVPHDQGQQYATSGVYACFYDLYFERGL